MDNREQGRENMIYTEATAPATHDSAEPELASQRLLDFSSKCAHPRCVDTTLLLQHYHPEKSMAYPLISSNTLENAIEGAYSQHINNIVVVDCRFEYEFEGGHIRNATNCPGWEQLEILLCSQPMQEKTLIVLYCEFSMYRVAKLTQIMRDRGISKSSTFAEIYILDGGYHAFYSERPDLCIPRGYVQMDAQRFKARVKMEIARFTKSMP